MIPLRGRCRTLSFQEVRGQNSWELLAKDMLGTKRPWNMHVNIYMYCIYTVCLHHSKLLMVHILTSSKDVASRPCLLERTVSDRIFYQNCLTKKRRKGISYTSPLCYKDRATQNPTVNHGTNMLWDHGSGLCGHPQTLAKRLFYQCMNETLKFTFT